MEKSLITFVCFLLGYFLLSSISLPANASNQENIQLIEIRQLLREIYAAEVDDDLDTKAKALHRLGNMMSKRKLWEQAHQYYSECYELRKHKGEKDKISIKYNLARASMHVGNFEFANALIVDYINFYNGVNNTDKVAKGKNMQGLILKSQKNYNEAILVFESAIQLNANQRVNSFLLNNIGEVYYLSGDVDKSLFYFEKAINIKSGILDTTKMLSTIWNLGSLHYELNNFDEAKKLLEPLMFISEKENIDFLVEGLEILAKIYEAEGKIIKANEVNKRALSLVKPQQRENNELKVLINELQVRKMVEEEEHLIQQAAMNIKMNERKNLLIITLIAGLVIACSLYGRNIYLKKSDNKKKSKMKAFIDDDFTAPR